MLTRILHISILICLALIINSCAEKIQDGAPAQFINTNTIQDPIPKALPKSRYGNPRYYVINDKKYWVLASSNNYNKTGIASWYGTKFHGRLTSTREKYDMMKMTAASPELPIPCYVYVTNLENNKRIIVKVNDRGPFAKNRIIDLSYVAAKKLDMTQKGTALVRVTSIDFNHEQMNQENHKPQLFAQVGAFSRSINAENMRNTIQSISRLPVIIKHQTKHDLYRVQIGPINDISLADRLIKKINQKYAHINAFSVVY
jgi:rare lipoprotein A